MDLGSLAVFTAAFTIACAAPGPSITALLARVLGRGPAGAAAFCAGLVLGDQVWLAVAYLGLAALAEVMQPVFLLIKYAGALYLLWLAWQAMRPAGPRGQARAQPASFARIVRMALLNNLVNPKALLFFMVFLPQFVNPSRGHVTLQLLLLGLTLAAAALVFNTLLGACSGQLGRRLQARPGAEKFQRGLLAFVMMGLALRLLLLDRPTKGI